MSCNLHIPESFLPETLLDNISELVRFAKCHWILTELFRTVVAWSMVCCVFDCLCNICIYYRKQHLVARHDMPLYAIAPHTIAAHCYPSPSIDVHCCQLTSIAVGIAAQSVHSHRHCCQLPSTDVGIAVNGLPSPTTINSNGRQRHTETDKKRPP